MSLTFNIQPFYGGVSLSQQYAWDEDLRNIANYLYRLCNYYIFEAEGVVATNSGQTIYNPNTGQVLNGFIPVDFQFIVGDVDSPLDPTNTFFTINDTRIFAGSLDVHVDAGELPVDLTNQVSYEPVYSQNSILVTFNQPLQVGQVVRGQYFKGVGVGGATKVSQPTIYYTFDSDVTEIEFAELEGVPLTDLRLIFRNTTNVRPVNAVVTDMNQLQYDNGTLGKFTCPTGDLFTNGNTLTIDYVA